jgi:hypothetical protein
MRNRVILIVFAGFVALVLLAGCGPGKYVPKANEEIYGTWINEGIRWQKLVVFAGGNKAYLSVADAEPDMETTEQISAKWKDGDGNIWYKTFDRWISGHLKGTKSQYLWKISNGSQMELTGEAVKDFNEKSFPLDLRSDRLADHRIYQKR